MSKTAMQELIEVIDFKLESHVDAKVLLVLSNLKSKLLKSLEKEKEQILKAHLNGQSEFDVLNYTEFNKDLAEEYYNQTYNQNK